MPISLSEVSEVRGMARSLSSLISNATDAELDAAIQKHAEPRVRLYLISATDSSGAHIFYTDISELPEKATDVENLVNGVFQEATVRSSLFRVMAAFSAAWVINAKVGIIESQQRIAYALEKQALADLDRLTKSPLIKTAVANAISKLREGLNFATTLLIAQDVNPTKKNTTTKVAGAYSGAQLPYATATIAGRARMWINGVPVSVNIAEGDTPVTAVQKIVNAFNSASASGGSAYNCNVVPSEVPRSSSTRTISSGVDSITGAQILDTYTYDYDSAKITILPKNYDNTLDIAVATLYLESPTEADPSVYTPGIKGFVYGTASAASQLTVNGPHSIAIDLKTGKTSTTTSSSTGQPVSDMLFFEGTSTAVGKLKYSIRGGKTAAIQRELTIPTATDPLKLVEIFANDLAGIATSQFTGLLGAVRPSTKLTLNGSSKTGPGIEFVAFQLSTSEVKVLVTVDEVPAGVKFAVVPPSFAVSGELDERPKTVVVDFTMARVSKTLDSGSSSGQSKGEVKLVTHKPSAGLDSIIKRLKDLQNGNDPR